MQTSDRWHQAVVQTCSSAGQIGVLASTGRGRLLCRVFDGEILARMTPIASGLKLSIPKQHAAVLAAGAPSNHQCHSKICGPKEASWRAKDSARAWTGAITMPGHLPLKCSFAWSSVLPIVKGTKCSTG